MPRPQKYPWERWFARKKGSRLRLCRGVHFDGLPHAMAQTVRNRSYRERRYVTVAVEENDIVIEFGGRR